jgi:hypothetical protein
MKENYIKSLFELSVSFNNKSKLWMVHYNRAYHRKEPVLLYNINICAESYASRAVKGPLEGSKIRYVEKMRKYPELGSRFKPLVVESTGEWHQYSFDYLKNIADHIAAKTNKTSIVALNTILTTASVCLQRHQGTMLVRRCLALF